MLGYETLTVRAEDSTRDRDQVVGICNDPTSTAQVFVADVNILNTGVNMHKCWYTGMFLNWHMGAQNMLQIIGRLMRMGQKGKVHWYLLKNAGSYHDAVERMLVERWLWQLSAESGLPRWLKGSLGEICVCEIMKTYWLAPFNRYTWIVEKDMTGADMNYHSERVIAAGHVFSIIAKLVLSIDPQDVEAQEWWLSHLKYLTNSALDFAKSSKTGKATILAAWLTLPVDELRAKFFTKFETVVAKLKKSDHDETAQLHKNIEMLEAAQKEREKGNIVDACEEIIGGGLASEDDDFYQDLISNMPPREDTGELEKPGSPATMERRRAKRARQVEEIEEAESARLAEIERKKDQSKVSKDIKGKGWAIDLTESEDKVNDKSEELSEIEDDLLGENPLSLNEGFASLTSTRGHGEANVAESPQKKRKITLKTVSKSTPATLPGKKGEFSVRGAKRGSVQRGCLS